MVSFELWGVPETLRFLGNAQAAIERAIDQEHKRTIYEIRREAMSYEAPIRGKPWRMGPGPAGGFYSVRQRRFVMAGIRSGRIRVPYPRTGSMNRRVVARRLPGGRPGAWECVMLAPESIFVRGTFWGGMMSQFWMHRGPGRWKPFRQIALKHVVGLPARDAQAVARALAGAA